MYCEFFLKINNNDNLKKSSLLGTKKTALDRILGSYINLLNETFYLIILARDNKILNMYDTPSAIL